LFRFSLLLLVLSLFMFCGCLPFYKYSVNRAEDFADIFGLNISVGAGLLVNIRATQFIQVGGVGFDGMRIGFNGRRGLAWGESSVELGIAPLHYGRLVMIEPGSSNMPDVSIIKNDKKEGVMRGQSLIYKIYREDADKSFDEAYDRRLFDFGFSVHFFFFGVEAFFNPLELIDFVLGLFCIDLMGDDRAVVKF